MIKVNEITIDPTDVESAVAAYTDATPGEKSKIRNAVQSAMMAAVRAMDLELATAWTNVSDALVAARTVRTEIDFNVVIAGRVRALRLAASMIESGHTVPDGIDRDMIDLDAVRTMIESADADTPEIKSAAEKIAGTKITRSTVRGSIEDHLETAFADLDSGTELTVAQIRTRSGAASDGAIAARVWPRGGKESTLDFTAMGIEPCMINGVRGLRKI